MKKLKNKRAISIVLIILFVVAMYAVRLTTRVYAPGIPGLTPQQEAYYKKENEKYEERKKKECVGLDDRACDIKLMDQSKEH